MNPSPTSGVLIPKPLAPARAHTHSRFSAVRTHARLAATLSGCAALLGVLACGGDRPTGPGTVQLQRISGDEQRAIPGRVLPQLLVVKLLDGRGQPIIGEPVEWDATNGTVTPITPTTDASGRAAAQWKLGETSGRDTAFARTARSMTVQFAASADSSAEEPVDAGLIPLEVETYDGSDQAVHPDHIVLPESWTQATQALVATPYPFGNANFENPSFYAGFDGDNWAVPAGLTNPLELPREGYLSDPDGLYDPESHELLVYYRQVTSQNLVWLIRSANGVQWSAPELVASAPNHQIISPTVVHRGPGDWLMWAVNAGAAGCTSASTTVELRQSTDGVRWSAPQPVLLDQPGGFAWHLDVEWIPSRSEFWAVYPLKTAGDCTTRALYFATSTDGRRWETHPTPLLSRGVIPELMDVVYRSTIEYDASSETVEVWYSGARYNGSAYVWRLARERLSLSALLGRVSDLAPSAAMPAPQGPPFTNATAP